MRKGVREAPQVWGPRRGASAARGWSHRGIAVAAGRGRGLSKATPAEATQG